MRSKITVNLVLSLILSAQASSQEWSRYRGIAGQGIGAAPDLPAALAEEHIAWRVPLTGPAQSSPVFWGSKLFLTRESTPGEVLELLCLDARSGEELWAYELPFDPYRKHKLNSFAGSTPSADADAVYFTWQSGPSMYVAALDHEGAELWQEEFGNFIGMHGSNCSPVVYGDLLYLAHDSEGDTGAWVALNRSSGEEVWRIPQSNIDNMACYTTAIPFQESEDAPVSLLFTSTVHGLSAVDPQTGELRWNVNPEFKTRCVATPAITDGMMFYSGGSGRAGKDATFVELPSEPGEAATILGSKRRNIPYVPSALALGGRFYLFADNGLASCIDAASQEEVWKQRMDGPFFSSPVSNGETIYILDNNGILYCLQPGDEYRELSRIDLGSATWAVPAIADGGLFVRTESELIRFGEPR